MSHVYIDDVWLNWSLCWWSSKMRKNQWRGPYPEPLDKWEWMVTQWTGKMSENLAPKTILSWSMKEKPTVMTQCLTRMDHQHRLSKKSRTFNQCTAVQWTICWTTGQSEWMVKEVNRQICQKIWPESFCVLIDEGKADGNDTMCTRTVILATRLPLVDSDWQ